MFIKFCNNRGLVYVQKLASKESNTNKVKNYRKNIGLYFLLNKKYYCITHRLHQPNNIEKIFLGSTELNLLLNNPY